jgi:hypothetical protein
MADPDIPPGFSGQAESPPFSQRAVCRERTAFPWTGVITGRTALLDAEPAAADLEKGDRVTVKEKLGGQFRITAQRHGQTCTGKVETRFVDEALCATIEDRLLGKSNITWDSNASWEVRWFAAEDFTLTGSTITLKAGTLVKMPQDTNPGDGAEWQLFQPPGLRIPKSLISLDTDSGGTPKITALTPRRAGFAYSGKLLADYPVPLELVTIHADEQITVQPSQQQDMWSVTRSGVTSEVSKSKIRADRGIPSPDSNIVMLCYQFAPYAAAIGGLLTDFITTATSGKASFNDWLKALGADPGQKQITRDQLGQTSFQRGDLIIFCAAGNEYIHLAVATGDKQNVYSLWNTPRDYPINVPIEGLWPKDDDASTAVGGMPTEYLRTATPAWHKPG